MNYELQKILFPSPDTCMAEVLYYHRNEHCFLETESCDLRFEQDGRASFDTYFNGFSVGKWKKYTKLGTLCLRLELSGCFTVSIVNNELVNGAIVGKVIDERIVSSAERKTFDFSYEGFHQKGMHTFILTASEDDSRFYGGTYYTPVETDDLADVGIALNMCTYRREAYIYRNLDRVRENILDNADSPLNGHLQIYVTDNAMTLEEERLAHPCIHLTKQNAFGSAGGFTRGLMRIQDDAEGLNLTHAVFLDDDIVLDTEVLCRTYALLRMMEPEYREAWVGGGMLGLDFPTLQTESGGVIEAGKYQSLKSGKDVGDPFQVLYNELEEGARINAWWYCVMPLRSLDENKLPYPVYFHCDDMEYASRMCKKLLLFNGLAVWHEEFFYKPDAYYYDKRNFEIIYALHYPDAATRRAAKKRLKKNVVYQLLWYRYNNAEEIVDGVLDFLKGPDWLIHADDRAKFETVRKNRVPMQPVTELDFTFDYNQYIASLSYPGESRRRRLWRKLTLNGWLLPANRKVIVRAETPITYFFYRAKKVLNYSAKNHSGYISEKSIGKALRIFCRMFGALWQIDRKYNRTREAYRTTLPEVTTRAFWQSRYEEENAE